MLLHALREYAGRDEFELPPPMYQPIPIRYVLTFDDAGRYLGSPADTASSEAKRGTIRLAPDCKRTMGVTPKLLSDNAEYVLGMAREGKNSARVQTLHTAFRDVVHACAVATDAPEVAVIDAFLASLSDIQLNLPPDFDPAATITFRVGNTYPIDLPSVKAFWARYAGVGEETNATLMQCLVCGELRPPVERLPIVIKGIPGGQTSGMSLISANASAFESYGLEASLIAPTCEDCGQRFGNALNTLLKQAATHLTIAPVAHIFWTREEVGFSIGGLFADPAPQDVEQLFRAPWRGTAGATDIDTLPFYAATLSASGARVVVRDWLETTLADAQRHLQRYFRLQCIDDGNELRYFPLRVLADATASATSRQREPAALVGQALLRLALHGGPLPEWLLFQVVRRLRAERVVRPAHVALIKMVLLAQDGKDITTMTELDQTNRDTAYLCGRLLAVLAATQRLAIGTLSATIVDRYYGTASSAPASVFGRLLRGAQPHLTKLQRDKRGAFLRLEAQLRDICADIPANGFPATLDLQHQGLFAVGFYHQKAADFRVMMEAKQRKAAAKDVSSDANSVDDTAGLDELGEE